MAMLAPGEQTVWTNEEDITDYDNEEASVAAHSTFTGGSMEPVIEDLDETLDVTEDSRSHAAQPCPLPQNACATAAQSDVQDPNDLVSTCEQQQHWEGARCC